MIQSLNRALALLEVLKNKGKNCSVAEISTKLELPPSTVHRILKTLCNNMYVTQDEKSHEYGLGPALISLGAVAGKNIDLKNEAYSILKELSIETGEDAFLIIPIGKKGYTLERINGPRTLKIVENFGGEMWLHYGAVRKAILAYKSKEFIDEYIAEIINTSISDVKISEKELREILSRTREEGIATSAGDYVKGTIGIGAPIFNSVGEVIASVGIVALKTENLCKERIERFKCATRRASKNISERMGYFNK